MCAAASKEVKLPTSLRLFAGSFSDNWREAPRENVRERSGSGQTTTTGPQGADGTGNPLIKSSLLGLAAKQIFQLF